MTEREKKFLSDILRSIELIENFIKDLKSYDHYQKDFKTKSAVERQLGIIGEALNKFLKESQMNKLENATQIISLRTVLFIHMIILTIQLYMLSLQGIYFL